MIIAKVIQEIQEQAEIDDHGGALLTAAVALGCEEIAEKLREISRQHDELGHLPPSLYYERETLYKDLMAFAKKAFSVSEYRALYDAF